MNEDKKEYILQWYEKADHDIMAAQRLIDIAPAILDAACFHCQQAVEKYLKAYLVYQGKDFEKTHNLVYLRDTCAEYDYDFENLAVKNLNDFNVDIRYPDDSLTPTLEEAKEYLQIVESIKNLVRDKITY